MRSRPARTALPEGARNYRTLMWILFVVGLGPVGIFWASVRGALPRELGISAVPLALGCFIAAAWMGWRGHQQALADRERAGHTAMILAIASQLGRQDDAALERMAAKGGPAGEAATWILAGRAEKRAKGG
jgi:hypothetical protein